MSVLITAKFQGDDATFRKALADRADEFVTITERAKRSGALHHRFGAGDGFVLIVDEWETPQDFEKFFADPELHEFIASVGAAPVPPEVTICEALTSADQF